MGSNPAATRNENTDFGQTPAYYTVLKAILYSLKAKVIYIVILYSILGTSWGVKIG